MIKRCATGINDASGLPTTGLTMLQSVMKRGFDILLAIFGLLLSWWLIILLVGMAAFDTKSSGLFVQKRVGKGAKIFRILKIRTMRQKHGWQSTVTVAGDHRITQLGAFLRRWKLDELPQLLNILFGQMSFVGPRPDVAGFLDQLEGEDRILWTLRPGLTGPASLCYRDEEELLRKQVDPETYNRTIIYPDKVKINKSYIQNYSLYGDVMLIIKTLLPHYG